MYAQPSVLAPAIELNTAPLSMEGFESFPAEGSSPSRRQRISMACQYCRHRKIRCCGGAPCRNCTRSQRECDYAPVPEEVNRATREKKAIAKATRSTPSLNTLGFPITPGSTYSPFLVDSPTFSTHSDASASMPYQSAATTGYSPLPPRANPNFPAHRRSISTPNLETSAYFPMSVSTPVMSSPAMFESATWMYGSPMAASGGSHANGNGSGSNFNSTPYSAPAQPMWTPALPVPEPQQQQPQAYHMTTAPALVAPPITPPRSNSASSAFPSVFEQPMLSSPMHAPMSGVPTYYAPQQAGPVTPPDSRSGSAEVECPVIVAPMAPPALPHSYSSPALNTYLRPQAHSGMMMAPQSPVSPVTTAFYTPYAGSPVFGHQQQAPMMYSPSPLSYSSVPTMPMSTSMPNLSPTLAPEMALHKDSTAMIGLGIGAGQMDIYSTPSLGSEEYFASTAY